MVYFRILQRIRNMLFYVSPWNLVFKPLPSSVLFPGSSIIRMSSNQPSLRRQRWVLNLCWYFVTKPCAKLLDVKIKVDNNIIKNPKPKIVTSVSYLPPGFWLSFLLPYCFRRGSICSIC